MGIIPKEETLAAGIYCSDWNGLPLPGTEGRQAGVWKVRRRCLFACDLGISKAGTGSPVIVSRR